jgi:hypothetical protein
METLLDTKYWVLSQDTNHVHHLSSTSYYSGNEIYRYFEVSMPCITFS